MEPFTTLTAKAIPFDQPNIDTDQIIPARFLSRPRPEQAMALFHDVRYNEDRSPRPDFIFNNPAFADARILVAGANFACGSSREMAVSVLRDNGFVAFIATSFGDIFHNNCYQNGVLPIVVPAARSASLRAFLHGHPGAEIAIDLAAQTVTGPDGVIDHFEIDPFRKECLLAGMDDVTLTLSHDAEIVAFEAKQRGEMAWL